MNEHDKERIRVALGAEKSATLPHRRMGSPAAWIARAYDVAAVTEVELKYDPADRPHLLEQLQRYGIRTVERPSCVFRGLRGIADNDNPDFCIGHPMGWAVVGRPSTEPEHADQVFVLRADGVGTILDASWWPADPKDPNQPLRAAEMYVRQVLPPTLRLTLEGS